jgi:hypothetical protein
MQDLYNEEFHHDLINGNKSNVREFLRTATKREAVLAVVGLVQHLAQEEGEDEDTLDTMLELMVDLGKQADRAL